MKTYLNKLIMLVAFSATFLVVGCEEEEIPKVEIQSVDVPAAYHLEEVTIQGANLSDVQFVFVGTRQADFEVNDDNTLTFTVPELAVPGMNKVTLAMAGSYRVTTDFEVLLRPVPVIQAITPSAAPSGEMVTIKGTSLNNIQSVTVGGLPATVDASSTADQLVITVPEGLPVNTPAVISITTTGGQANSESIFYAGENLVQNSELELGDGDEFTNWGKWNGGAGMTATTDPSEAYSGRSLKVVSPGPNPWSAQFVSDAMPTETGVEQTLYMWIKAEAGSPGDGGTIRFSTTPSAMYSGDYTITSEWQQIEWTFTANVENTQIALDMGVVTDAVYFVDNITVVASGNSGPQNLLANSSFEDGLTDWEVLNGTIEATTEDAHNGSNAVKVTPAGGNPWETQMASIAVPLTFEGNYEIRLWAKGAGPGGVMRVSASQFDGSGADYFYGGDAAITEDWAEYTWTFQVGKDLPGHKVVLDMGAGSQVLFIDDVTLREVE